MFSLENEARNVRLLSQFQMELAFLVNPTKVLALEEGKEAFRV